MFTFGSGPPLVMIPGLDGHWTWLRPAIDALARHFTVVTFSLCGERDSRDPLDEASGFDAFVAQARAAMDRAGRDRVTLCGVSYGGWIALRCAAERPDRTTALVLVSSPPPGFEPSEQQWRYLSAPRRYAPAFVLTAPARVLPEVRAALPSWRERARFLAGHASRVARTGTSPTRMALRMRQAAREDFFADCRRVTAPTLIVTGEHGLDRVVPAGQTQKYVSLIRDARHVTLPRTGHIGCLTRAGLFADTVSRFTLSGPPGHLTAGEEYVHA